MVGGGGSCVCVASLLKDLATVQLVTIAQENVSKKTADILVDSLLHSPSDLVTVSQ